MSAEGMTKLPIYLTADMIDRAIQSHGLSAGSLNGCRVLPSRSQWPERCAPALVCGAVARFPGWVLVNAEPWRGVNVQGPQRGGVVVRLVGVAVVGLGAWSELARKGQQGMDIDVHEFAVLDDGRRLMLHQERGFSTSATRMTADHAERSVLMTVLPDDAEVTGEDHPWEWLASLIRAHGVAGTPEQLKTVPYVVELGPRLSAVLESENQQER